MMKKFSKTIFVLAIVFSFMTGSVIAAECKGSSKSSCSANSSCTWVKGYSKKDGAKVRGYCRSKGKSGDARDKKSKDKKSKKSKDKKSKKSKDKKSKKSKDKKSKKSKDKKSKKSKDKKSK